jgi:hypothetical protein
MRNSVALISVALLVGPLDAQQRVYPFPMVEPNACPLECCHFGDWTVLQPVMVYAREADRHSRTVRLGSRTHVVADSGTRHIERPGIMIVDAPQLDARRYVGETLDGAAIDSAVLRLHRGDTVYVTAELADPGGEITWFHGHAFWPYGWTGTEQAREGLFWTVAAPGAASPAAHEAQTLKDIWWVHIRYGPGASGWIDATHAPSIEGMGESHGTS